MGGEAMEAHLAVRVLQGRVALVRPRHPAASDAQHDRLAGCADRGPHVLERGAQFLGITRGDDLREDVGGALRHRAADREQSPAGEAAPGAGAPPGLALQGRLTFEVTLPPRTEREARPRRCMPPTRAGPGTAPEAGFVS
jgi:hypothetical protein